MYCLSINKTELPKSIAKSISDHFDDDGWLHGYLAKSAGSTVADFMNESVLFRCINPIMTLQTHLIIRYATAVIIGYDSKANKNKLEYCELTFFFNTQQNSNGEQK